MPKYAEEILAAVTELQQHPTAEQVFLEMKREHPSMARSPDLQPVRENHGRSPAGYAGADPGGTGAGDPLLRP